MNYRRSHNRSIREAKIDRVREWLKTMSAQDAMDRCVKEFDCTYRVARVYVKDAGGVILRKRYRERLRRLEQVKEWLATVPKREIIDLAMDEFGCSRRRAKRYMRDVLTANPGMETYRTRWLEENEFPDWPLHRDLILKIVHAHPGLTTQQIVQMEWVDYWTTFSTGPRLYELFTEGKVSRAKQDGNTGPYIWFPR